MRVFLGHKKTFCHILQRYRESITASLVALGKFIEQAHDGFKVGHARKAEQAFQDRVMAGDFTVFEAVGATPY